MGPPWPATGGVGSRWCGKTGRVKIVAVRVIGVGRGEGVVLRAVPGG
ncbi:MAG: hypothetical protein M3Y49_07000 [Actinomycetota bacterium]|nr:hypothetical protein [Actinomycetota bacterium]